MICPSCKKETPDKPTVCIHCGKAIELETNDNNISIIKIPVFKTALVFFVGGLFFWVFNIFFFFFFNLLSSFLLEKIISIIFIGLIFAFPSCFFSGILAATLLNVFFKKLGGYNIVIRK